MPGVGRITAEPPSGGRRRRSTAGDEAAVRPPLSRRRRRRTPDAVAVAAGGDALTYASSTRGPTASRTACRRSASAPRSSSASASRARSTWSSACSAILKAGGAYVPLDPAYPPDRLAFMVDDAAAPRPGHASGSPTSRPPDAGAAVVLRSTTTGDALAAEPTRPPRRRAGPSNLAYVIYTSGSTGTAQGRAWSRTAAWSTTWPGAREPTRVAPRRGGSGRTRRSPST